ncbi:HdeD family acid-resistance protein [soil metagenome]
MTDNGTLDTPLASLAKGVWWLLLLRGVLAVIFGIIAIIAPAAALTGVALVIGAYAIVDGVATAVHSFQIRSTNPRWGWLLASGVVTTLAGLAALILPAFAGFFGGLFVLWTVVFWTIMTGILGLRSAAGAPSGRAKTWGIISGVASLVFGVILAIALAVNPGAAVLSLVWVVGIWAIVFGAMLVATAIMVRTTVKAAAA